MSSIINPMDALPSFEEGVRTGSVWLQPAEVVEDIFVHMDNPDGTRQRFTYAQFDGDRVTALAMATPVDSHDGELCIQIGYAVSEDWRGQGRAKEIARAAITELRTGLGRNGIKSFYVEAIVGLDNIASQRVAEAVLGISPKPIIDEPSGEQALQYIALFEANAGNG